MADSVTPYKESKLGKKQQIARMFNNIAWRYDFLNHFLSFGIDHYWRKKAIQTLKNNQVHLLLDVATGTGDFAISALKLNPRKIFGIDISADMLEIGRKKIRKKNLQDKIELLESDSEKLLFEDNKFDAVAVAFGVRNFEYLEKGLIEMLRVLRPGGKVVILEFSKPSSAFIRSFYNLYSKKIAPWIGKKISGDAEAYTYLHKSVDAFPSGKEFTAVMERCGYKNCRIQALTFGVVSIYTATK